jgi:hypothetical protein
LVGVVSKVDDADQGATNPNLMASGSLEVDVFPQANLAVWRGDLVRSEARSVTQRIKA